MRIVDNIPVWGNPVDDGAMEQIRRCSWIFQKAAMMADHHKGYGVPIGGVIADPNLISPAGVGYDIGCGNKAVKLDVKYEEIRAKIATIMNDVWSTISFGIGRKNEETVDHDLFSDPAWKEVKTGSVHTSNHWALSRLKELARSQLGTVGSGNHFVDIFREDPTDDVWIGVHFGSRGLGHKTATHFMRRAGAKDDMDSAPVVALDARTEEGQLYLRAMELAGRYAYAGRDWVCDRVARIIGGRIVDSVHNHHNFARRENHNGEDLWVVRKRATPAFPGQRGFIGGTMAEVSVIIEGVSGAEEAAHSLCSTIHGAGRVMGRSQAKGKRDKVTGEWMRTPLVTPEMMTEWVRTSGIELRGGGVDESPHCYKRLDDVFAETSGIRVLHRLVRVGVAMAGKDEHDPYKD